MLHVVVVGGGPAGLVAAEALAKAGVATTVLESHPGRLLPCAGLLTQPAMEAMAVPELLLAQRLNEVAIFSPTSRVAFVSLGALERYAGVMRRELLQSLLRRRAEEAGATIRHAAFRRFVHSDGDYPMLEVALPNGERERLSADIVVGADGVHSRVARALGLPPLELGVAYMEKVSLPTAQGAVGRAPEGMQLHFGRKVSADRYGWMMPHLDHLVLGVATHARYGKRVWDMLAELKKRMGSQLDGARPSGREAFMFPLGRRAKLTHDRVLLVGDAAGVGPAATMDGLYYAAMSGRLAAETILAHRNLPTPERLAEYDARWQAAHGAAYEGVARVERMFFANDKRREALLDLAWDRLTHRAAVDAFLAKKPLDLPLAASLKLRGRMAASLLKYSLSSPKRGEGEHVARALPQGENYLDLALKPGGGLQTLPPLREVLGPDDPAALAAREEA